jgi:hypothetical protein
VRRIAASVMLIALIIGACSGSARRLEGVVVDVDGDLTGVESFEIVSTDGQRLRFVPDEGVENFAHGGPLTHLTEHLQTGSPIRVTYEHRDGTLVAVEVDDAS